MLAVGIVGWLQTRGSLVNWHPHIHVIATGEDAGAMLAWPHSGSHVHDAVRTNW
jgi:hypothetical protein